MKLQKLALKILIPCLFMAGPVFAGQPLPPEREPGLDKGAVVEVQKYDKDAKVYHLMMPAEPDVGPNRAKLDDFAKALPKIAIKKDPEAVVGSVYKLDRDLPLLSDLGVEKELRKNRRK